MKQKHSRIPAAAMTAHEVEAQALERYRPLLPGLQFDLLVQELQQPLRMAIRANSLKVDAGRAVEEWSQRYHWQVTPIPYCDTGWWIVKAEFSVSKTLEHALGYYYIQDAASMLPVELFSTSKNADLLTLDMAASPGGKTTHLVNKSGDRGLIIANDANSARITALRLVVQEDWGSGSTAITQFPGEHFGTWFPERFDRVLLDAPCSMENLRSTSSHPMRPISLSDQQQLSYRQARLLESALAAVKVGGEVVYSTCSLSPDENEAVLDSVLRQYPGMFRVESVQERLPFRAPGITHPLGNDQISFHPDISNAVRLWPHICGTSGFFSALLTKTGRYSGSNPAPDLPRRLLEKVDLTPLKQCEKIDLVDDLQQVFGFDLAAILELEHFTLWQRGSHIFVFPEAYLRHFSTLPCRAIGLELGETTLDGFVPSHEWAARFFSHFHNNRCCLPGEYLMNWLRGEDIHSSFYTTKLTGRVVIVEDSLGRFLGRGKPLPNRMKNLLPKRLVMGLSAS